MREVVDFLVLKWHAKDTKSCKQHMHNMLKVKSIKASEVHYTRSMQYQAQRGLIVQNSPKTP